MRLGARNSAEELILVGGIVGAVVDAVHFGGDQCADHQTLRSALQISGSVWEFKQTSAASADSIDSIKRARRRRMNVCGLCTDVDCVLCPKQGLAVCYLCQGALSNKVYGMGLQGLPTLAADFSSRS